MHTSRKILVSVRICGANVSALRVLRCVHSSSRYFSTLMFVVTGNDYGETTPSYCLKNCFLNFHFFLINSFYVTVVFFIFCISTLKIFKASCSGSLQDTASSSHTMVPRMAVTPSLIFVFMRLVNGFVLASRRRYHRHCGPNLELGGRRGKGEPHVMPGRLHQGTNWSCGGGGRGGSSLQVTNK